MTADLTTRRSIGEDSLTRGLHVGPAAARAVRRARADEGSASLQRPSAQRPLGAVLAPLFATIYVVALGGLLLTAFLMRDEEIIVPKEGAGYWIGIVGGLILLFLLLYPVRKKRAKDAKLGSVATWFQWHMILGLLGPTLILLHSNFHLKSVNATVATVIMLSVVASGVIGRFLYRKVHKGLYETKAEVSALLSEAHALYGAFGEEMQGAPGLLDELKRYEHQVLTPHLNPVQSLIFIVRMALETRLSRYRVVRASNRLLEDRARQENWGKVRLREVQQSVHQHVRLYFETVRKAAELKFYNRLFGLWHLLHLPLFLLLIFAAIVHIVAVHLY